MQILSSYPSAFWYLSAFPASNASSTVQPPSVLLCWGGNHFHPATPAPKACQESRLTVLLHDTPAITPNLLKDVSIQTSACVKHVCSWGMFWFMQIKHCSREAMAVKLPRTSTYRSWPPTTKSNVWGKILLASSTHCWTLNMVMDAQMFLGAGVEVCPEQLAGTRGKLPHQFLRCGWLHKCFHWKVKQNNFT